MHRESIYELPEINIVILHIDSSISVERILDKMFLEPMNHLDTKYKNIDNVTHGDYIKFKQQVLQETHGFLHTPGIQIINDKLATFQPFEFQNFIVSQFIIYCGYTMIPKYEMYGILCEVFKIDCVFYETGYIEYHKLRRGLDANYWLQLMKSFQAINLENSISIRFQCPHKYEVYLYCGEIEQNAINAPSNNPANNRKIITDLSLDHTFTK